MEKKIEALKAAYAKQDRIALIKAAKSLTAYNRKHPMAKVVNPGASEIVLLAYKIIEAA